jgi:hypothetical protein
MNAAFTLAMAAASTSFAGALGCLPRVADFGIESEKLFE